MTPLYEIEGGDADGPLWGYYCKGHASDEEIAEFALDYDYNPVAFVACVTRCRAHWGKNGAMFMHAEPGRGRFLVTVVDIFDYREVVRLLGEVTCDPSPRTREKSK
jgi:hypothetical protein